MKKNKKKGATLLSIEDEFEMVQKVCEEYGYRAFLRFNEIHIRTRFEAWYFVPADNGMIRLMHSNQIGAAGDKWHCQFCRNIKYSELVEYIYEHETAKFTNRFVKFKFTKTGLAKAAIA